MIPFFKPKAQASVIVQSRKPDGTQETVGSENESDPGLMAAAEDLIRAIHAKDAQGVASALKAAVELSGQDSEPFLDPQE